MGLILAAGLLLLGAGCTARKPAENVNANTNANVNEAQDVEEGEGNVNAVNPGVTAEELNQLNLEIKGMEYDDLNALTK